MDWMDARGKMHPVLWPSVNHSLRDADVRGCACWHHVLAAGGRVTFGHSILGCKKKGMITSNELLRSAPVRHANVSFVIGERSDGTRVEATASTSGTHEDRAMIEAEWTLHW